MTEKSLKNQTSVALGIVPTHLKFVGALLPDEAGQLPRNEDGELLVLAGCREICETSPVKLDHIQISTFAHASDNDNDELFTGLRQLSVEPQIVMMVGGVNPLDPKDEDTTVEQLLKGLQTAFRNDIKTINSTSIEAWMEGDEPKDEADFQARLAQAVKLHARVYREAKLGQTDLKSWNIEFLRPGEFQTFTTLGKLNQLLTALNAEIGSTFFRGLVDAAHCGDSGLSIPENQAIMAEVGKADHLGVFHASVPTTRGCLSTDDGWVGALLRSAAETGKLTQAYVELFHHEDDTLAGLRKIAPGHGIDTRDGRTYPEVVVDNLIELTHRLNNLKARRILS